MGLGFDQDDKGFGLGLGQILRPLVNSNRFTGFGGLAGQSNNEAVADFGSTAGSDSSYNISNTIGFSSCLMDQKSAVAPASPMVWHVDTGLVTLRAWAAAGSPNMGPEQTLGRYLVNYGVCTSPILYKTAVQATSLRRHWLPTSGYPASGEKLYDTFINRLIAAQILHGKKLEFLVWDQGETDAGDATDVSTRQANLGTMFTAVRTALGVPNLPVFMCKVNSAQATGDVTGVNAANAAYAATDPYCVYIDFDTVRLHNDPHYDASGQIGRGEMMAVAIHRYFFPSATGNRVVETVFPYYQQTDAGMTCVASPDVAKPRSGPWSKEGDYEIAVATSYGVATTITASDAQGFTAIGSPVTSTFNASTKRQLAVFGRAVAQATLDANGGRMPTPSFDMGTTVLNVARIFGLRNVRVSDPIGAISTGANNTSNTSLTIAGGSTTAQNALIVMIILTAGASNSISNIVNSDFTEITNHWDGRYNPGSGTVGICFATARKASPGTYGATTITMGNNGVNVGMCIEIKPPL